MRSKTERELVRVKTHDGNAFWNEIRVNASVSKLMLLSLNLLLLVLVYAVRHSLTAVRHKLMLSGITYYCWFWATAKAKTVNGERQIQALVDKKKVIITKKSVRSDLMLEDAERTECLPNDVIFEQLTLMSAKTTAWNEFSSTMAICIHLRKQRKDSGPTEPIPDEQVLDLEEEKTAQAKEIASLKKRIKQLKKIGKSRTLGLKRLRKISSASRVESSNDVSLGAQEDASKQGRKIADLDANAEVTLIDEAQERYDEEMLFDVQDDLQGEEVVAEKEVAEKEVSAADPVTTAGEVVTTASATTTVDELTLAQTLIEIKAAKLKGMSMTSALIVSSHNFHKQKIKARENGLHAEEQAELEKERVAQEEASKEAIIEELDSIQAMIDVDDQFAARLQVKKQGTILIEIPVKGMLVEMIAERKKFFAAQRAAEQRNELESDKSKKQKIDEHVEAKKDDDQKEAEMKKHIEIVKDDEVAIDDIPLATKPLVIFKYKVDKDGRIGYFKLRRADGSSKRPEEDYERVLWGDLKQCQDQIKIDKAWKQKESTSFRKLNVQYFEIQDLKAQLQDKGIAISELKKLIEKMKGKSMETKFEKSSVIRQPNAFKSQRQSLLGDPLCPILHRLLILLQLVEIILLNVDSGCSKHMTRNLKLQSNIVEKFLGMVKFGNDQIAPLGHGDLLQGNVTIKRVYYVEGLNLNLFSVCQFCDADLEVAFWKSTCYIRDLNGNDLLTGSRGINLYSITLQDTTSPNPIYLMAKASSSQAWL
ncbi:hypothetical protein Tco_0946631 [Tanacetum coccineum]